jgi:hypothetical protein
MEHVWLLNFGADAELSRVNERTPPVDAHRAALTRTLAPLTQGGRLLNTIDAPMRMGAIGHAWMMTEGAAEQLTAAGAQPASVPGDALLRLVNSRAFSQRLGVRLPGSALATSLSELERVVDGARPWVLRREHGFAARGRMLLDAGLSESARTWAQRSFEVGEVIECTVWMQRTQDFALHGYVDGARVYLGAPTEQVCDARGQWQETRRTDALSGAETRALIEAAEETGAALSRAHYTGPFGIDAFRHEQGFCPRCEINARYSMGWAIGMGDVRPDLAVHVRAS